MVITTHLQQSKLRIKKSVYNYPAFYQDSYISFKFTILLAWTQRVISAYDIG